VNIARLLAHSGGFGWDEALFLLLPVVVLVLLGRQAKRKAAEEDAEDVDGATAEGDRRRESPDRAESTDHPGAEG
jgi:hypothetical protein